MDQPKAVLSPPLYAQEAIKNCDCDHIFVMNDPHEVATSKHIKPQYILKQHQINQVLLE